MRVSKEANREYQRKWYSQNKKLQIKRNSKRRKLLRKWFQEQKLLLKCCMCPENHPACIDFHHTNPQDKSFNLSVAIAIGYGKSRILEEIAKCKPICANCHRKLHYKGNNQCM